MRRLLNYFLRGLVLIAPIAFTAYVCVTLFQAVDSWVDVGVPGAGFAITVVLITVTGALGSSFVTRSAVALVEKVLARLPFVRLLYGSTKDLLNAFVGERRRFDRPVLVRLHPDSEARAFGFVTQGTLEALALHGQVAVYLPQSYNVAGQLWALPADAVTPLDADSSEVMAFIVSGGVTALPGTRRAAVVAANGAAINGPTTRADARDTTPAAPATRLEG
jgi:uncharacterized membrane protein